MKLAIAAAMLAAVLVGCGDSTGTVDSDPPAAEQPEPTEGSSSEPTEDPSSEPAGDDEALIEQTLITWDIEGGCEHVTDKFLEEQTFISDREEACTAYESAHVEKLYEPEDIVISDIQVDGDAATAVFGSTIAPDLTVTYSLVKVDGAWLVDGFEF